MNQYVNYSIIIPHKNRPLEIENCLNSIPQRDDLEVIIVDDNSSESVVDFTHFPNVARNDVKVIRITNSKGAGKARNTGVREAKGKWLLFCDCDDCFSIHFNEILNKHLQTKEDIVFYGVTCVDEATGEEINNYHFDYYKNNIETALSTGNYEILRYGMNPPWGKILKRDFIVENTICFDETPVANDVMFSVKSGYYAKTVGCSPDLLYRWTVSSNSITTQKSVDKINCHLDVNIAKNRYLKEVGKFEYHQNLFKILKKYSGLGVAPVVKAIIKIIRNTPINYVLKDFMSATKAALR